MEYNNKQIIQSFFWLGTDKKCKCEDYECQSGHSCCLDRDQMILLETLLDGKKSWDITFDFSPFWNSDEERCHERAKILPDKIPLLKPGMDKDASFDCFNDDIVLKLILMKMGFLYTMPVILGINSRYRIEERETVIRFCLQSKYSEDILEKILTEILYKVFDCYINKEGMETVQRFTDVFFEKLEKNFSWDEELDACIKNKYEKCIDKLEKENIDHPLASKLKKYYIKQEINPTRMYHDAGEFFTEILNERVNIRNVLYLIQVFCEKARCSCNLPEVFRKENLYRSEKDIPTLIRKFIHLFENLSKWDDWKEKEIIIHELIEMIKKRGLTWDEELIFSLYEKMNKRCQTQ